MIRPGRFFALVLLLLAVPPAGAQCPPQGSVLYPGLTGQELLDTLRVRFRPVVTLGYNGARDVLYSKIDNHDGLLTGVYTGFTIHLDPASPTPRADAFAAGINAEHTWPQSEGAGNLPAMADMNHIFPSEINANAARGNLPFDEIPDDQTDRWYRLNQNTTTPQPQFLDEYSELDNQNPNPHYPGRFEPREIHKGNVARAMFYFYAMYRQEADAADPNFFPAQKEVFRSWNTLDPPDSAEYARACAIAGYQEGKYNPFVIDTTLIARAYFETVPVRLAAFSARTSGGTVTLSWTTAAETDHLGFLVYRRSGADLWDRLTRSLLRGGPDYQFVDLVPVPGQANQYTLEALGRAGDRERFGPLTIEVPPLSLINATAEPNPSRGAVIFHLALPAPGDVSIRIVDVRGRLIREVVTTAPDSGPRDVAWEGRDAGGAAIPPGVYFYQVRSGGLAAAGKLIRN